MTASNASMANLDPAQLDEQDSLRHMRQRFHLPNDVIYLDGNSLGPASHAALAALKQAAHDEWAEGLIRSWNTAGWFNLPKTLGGRIAPLVGAAPDQLIVCDTVTLNLYKLLHAALSLRPGRRHIVAEASSFPTDLYIAQGVARHFPGVELKLSGRDADTLEELIDEETAVVLVNHVDYRSGVLQDMASITATAHEAGALAVWDLCHSVGAMPIELDACQVDFAVGCTYKYLNGGPGAAALAYVAARHHANLDQPLAGWWGHARPFDFEINFTPAPGVRSLQTSTQAMLSMRCLEGALSDWHGVDLQAVREKSLRLTQYFMDLVESRLSAYPLQCITPSDPKQRGSQVSIQCEHAYPLVQALIARGVIGDFRAPDVMRFGFTPLYLGFSDVARAVDILQELLETKAWQDPAYAVRQAVT